MLKNYQLCFGMVPSMAFLQYKIDLCVGIMVGDEVVCDSDTVDVDIGC